MVFLHIQKTGGITLREILRRKFSRAQRYELNYRPIARQDAVRTLRDLPLDARREIRYLDGHLFYGVHEWLPREAEYVTILRHPVDRTISHFYYLRGLRPLLEATVARLGAESPETLSANEQVFLSLIRGSLTHLDTLDDFIAFGRELNSLNVQTRMIGGFIDRDAIHPPHAPLPSDSVSVASENLERHFVMAGTLERFDECILWLKGRYRWSQVFYTRRNVTPRRVPSERVSRQTRNEIERLCREDMELYEIVQQRLEEKLSADADAIARARLVHSLGQPLWGLYERSRSWLRRAGARLSS